MKKLSILLFTLLSYSSFAQLNQIVNELYGFTASGEEVYRIYAELQDPTDFVSALWGAGNNFLYLGSDIGGIVNVEGGAITGDVLQTGFCVFVPEICFDSYITVGHAGNPSPGVTVYWDNMTPIPCGQAVIAISTLPSAADFSQSFEPALGENLVLMDGAWFSTNLPGCNDQGLPFGMNNRVLLAQIAVPLGGHLDYKLNIQVHDEADMANDLMYVWDSNAVGENQIDGSAMGLIYPLFGCSDSTACNFDPAASVDDGSCYYEPCVAIYDLNNDGVIGMDDLLQLITNFGCIGPDCIGDFNSDGMVNMLDLMAFFIWYGATYP